MSATRVGDTIGSKSGLSLPPLQPDFGKLEDNQWMDNNPYSKAKQSWIIFTVYIYSHILKETPHSLLLTHTRTGLEAILLFDSRSSRRWQHASLFLCGSLNSHGGSTPSIWGIEAELLSGWLNYSPAGWVCHMLPDSIPAHLTDRYWDTKACAFLTQLLRRWNLKTDPKW